MSAAPKIKKIGGSKNGETRTIPDHTQRAPKWYPADDIKQPKKSRKTPRPTKLRPSVSPPLPIVCVMKLIQCV
jgi:large subunit ribosomal protein L6e